MNFKRILLKLSGESLAGENGFGIDSEKCLKIVKMIKKCININLEISMVIGAGNFWRGRTGTQITRINSDKMGILATAMNALAFSDILEKNGIESIIQSSKEIQGIVPAFLISDAIKALKKKKVVLFSCGIGSPFFSTDTAAALRASEISADAVLKATTVDGVYSSDPRLDKNAVKYDFVTYDEVIEKNLRVMDMTAISLCRETKIPILVFKFDDLEKIILGQNLGTYISD